MSEAQRSEREELVPTYDITLNEEELEIVLDAFYCMRGRWGGLVAKEASLWHKFENHRKILLEMD